MARRSRRKDRGTTIGLVAAGCAVLLLVALVINGIVSAATSSTSYLQLINRSFTAQANSIFAAQNAQGRLLTQILTSAPAQGRRGLQQQLDLLVRTTATEAAQATTATRPAPSGDLGPRFERIVADRALGASEIRGAIDGLLGMTPLPIAGAPSTPPLISGALLSSTEAATQLTQAGALIASADAAVGGLRRSVAAAPGHPTMIRSVFVKDPTLLSASSMNQLVTDLEASTSLTVVHELTLLAVSLRPSALPTPGSTSTNLPPTTTLVVTTVIKNLGNVAEKPVVVTASTTPVAGGIAGQVQAVGKVAANGAVSITLPTLAVRPGTPITLQISLTPPAGQGGNPVVSQTQTVVIAPATSALG